MLTNEQVEADSKAAKAHCMEEQVRAAEEESELLRVARVRVDDLTAEHASLAIGD